MGEVVSSRETNGRCKRAVSSREERILIYIVYQLAKSVTRAVVVIEMWEKE